MTPMQEIETLIKSHIKDGEVVVSDMTGTQDHLDILVASDIFKGKMLFQQHKIVMDILNESLKQKIHAVKIKTMTLEAYQKLQS